MILTAREKTNYGPLQLQFLCGRHRSTIWKVLKRHGVSRQRRTQRPQSTRRYEWTEAGALLHIDAMELPKFEVVGHWAHGDRADAHRTRQAGKVKVIGVIDDHTRLAYCEIHAAENARTVSATLRRAAAWMGEQGCGPVQAVMSDNALCYARSSEFRDTLASKQQCSTPVESSRSAAPSRREATARCRERFSGAAIRVRGSVNQRIVVGVPRDGVPLQGRPTVARRGASRMQAPCPPGRARWTLLARPGRAPRLLPQAMTRARTEPRASPTPLRSQGRGRVAAGQRQLHRWSRARREGQIPLRSPSGVLRPRA